MIRLIKTGLRPFLINGLINIMINQYFNFLCNILSAILQRCSYSVKFVELVEKLERGRRLHQLAKQLATKTTGRVAQSGHAVRNVRK